jgi:kynureninase
VEERAKEFGLEIASPLDRNLRGSQVSVRHPESYRVMRALIDRGVIGDFRTPDLMRFGFAPLYNRYVDAWDAAAALHDVLQTRAWARPEYATRLRVT